MSTRGQPYHHGNLRPVLVDTAVELARTTGPDGVVLREVARRAGVSHNAAYRHFADRAALLAEVSDCAMADLEEAMRRAHRRGDARPTRPPARSSGCARPAGPTSPSPCASPGLFAVAFTAPEGAVAHSDPATLTGPYAVLNAVLDELVECGAVTPERRARRRRRLLGDGARLRRPARPRPAPRGARRDARAAARDRPRRRAPRARSARTASERRHDGRPALRDRSEPGPVLGVPVLRETRERAPRRTTSRGCRRTSRRPPSARPRGPSR